MTSATISSDNLIKQLQEESDDSNKLPADFKPILFGNTPELFENEQDTVVVG